LQGKAADAKAVGDEISSLKQDLDEIIPVTVKNAIDTILQNVAFKNADIYTDEITVIHNWASQAKLVSISVVYMPSKTVYDTDSIDVLRDDLVVTAHYDNSSTAVINDYVLNGTFSEGVNTISVIYGRKTAMFTVTVVHRPNLFDPDTSPDVKLYVDTQYNIIKKGTPYHSTYIPVTVGKTYTISKIVSNSFRIALTASEPANGATYLYTEANHSGTEMTIEVTQETASYLFVTYAYNVESLVNDEIRQSMMIYAD